MKHQIGDRFGNLVLIERLTSQRWLMRCDCGAVTNVFVTNVINGRTKGCGCRRVTDEPTYMTVHSRLRSAYGPATDYECIDGDDDHYAHQWSYSVFDRDQMTDPKTGCAYSTNLDYYLPRCRRCHRAHDQVVARRRRATAAAVGLKMRAFERGQFPVWGPRNPDYLDEMTRLGDLEREADS